jgi:hypothetical protein
MTRAAKITIGVCVAIVAGLVAIATPAVLAAVSSSATAPHATSSITSVQTLSPSVNATQPPDVPSPGPAVASDPLAPWADAVATFPLPLPAGYVFPTKKAVSPAEAESRVWDFWVGATIDAAVKAQAAGDSGALARDTSLLETAWDTHLSALMSSNASFFIDDIRAGQFHTPQQMYRYPSA